MQAWPIALQGKDVIGIAQVKKLFLSCTIFKFNPKNLPNFM